MKSTLKAVVAAAVLAFAGIIFGSRNSDPQDLDTFTIRRYYVDERLVTCVVALEFESVAMDCDWSGNEAQ